jgi:catechol 2,3-dioxygenase-like lactoylglutathione lyase family enzyme
MGAMEEVIAKLLGEFEEGRISRRQLIRSLAAALAAPAPADSQPAGFQAVAVNHISYQVSHYAKTRDFYAGLLGMKVSHDNGRECRLSFGNSILLPRNGRAGTRVPRIDHVAYTIDNWNRDAVERELKRRGLQPRSDTADSFHVQDPDGFDLQICGKDMMKP